MERDTNKNLSVNKALEQAISGPLGFFLDDPQFVFFFKKAERVVSAIYLITGFFDDNEPLKWRLRNLGSELLSASLSLKDGSRVKQNEAENTLRDLILESLSILSVAKNSNMVSEMNFNIMNSQLNILAESLPGSIKKASQYKDQQNKEERRAGDLNRSFFEEDEDTKLREEVSETRIESGTENRIERKDTKPESRSGDIVLDNKLDNKGHLPHSSGLLDLEPEDAHSKALARLKYQTDERSSQASKERRSAPHKLKEFGAVAVKKNSRQSIIISLLKRKKEIMIKDVSPLIDGCSEKTIQRELLAMVEAGILRKEGEKRWSRYSLVKP
jgi:hypothetical protein